MKRFLKILTDLVKTHTTEWEEILIYPISDKRLVSRLYEERLEPNDKNEMIIQGLALSLNEKMLLSHDRVPGLIPTCRS